MSMQQQVTSKSKIFFYDSQHTLSCFDVFLKRETHPFEMNPPRIFRADTKQSVEQKITDEEIFKVLDWTLKGSLSYYNPMRKKMVWHCQVFPELLRYFYGICQTREMFRSTAKRLIEKNIKEMDFCMFSLGGILQFFQPITKLNMIYCEPRLIMKKNKESFARYYDYNELIFLDVSNKINEHSFVPLCFMRSCWADKDDEQYPFLKDLSERIFTRTTKDRSNPCNYITFNSYRTLTMLYPELIGKFIEQERAKLLKYFSKEILDNLDFFELSYAQGECARKMSCLPLEEAEEVVEIWVGSQLKKIESDRLSNPAYKDYYIFENPQYRITLIDG